MNWELVYFVIAVVCGLFGIWFLGRRRNFFTALMGIFWFLAVLFQQYLPRVSSFVVARGLPSVGSLILYVIVPVFLVLSFFAGGNRR